MLVDMDEDGLRSRFKRDYSTLDEPNIMPSKFDNKTDQHEDKTSKNSAFSSFKVPKLNKRVVVISASVFLIVILGAVCFALLTGTSKPKTNKSSGVLGKSTTTQSSIPVYYPKNLPNGYVYNNDFSMIKTNVYYFTVTAPGNQVFYITQQPIPTNFDFKNFDGKFQTPDQYTVNIGSVTAGTVGANKIGSIQTANNTWIIINAPNTNSLTALETITRSFSQNK